MTSSSKITTVLFDLDGTILDTNELIIQSFIYALEGIVPEAFGRDDIIPVMGQTLISQLRQFSGREDVTELTVAYRKYNLDKHDEMVTLFPGVEEVVHLLKSKGIKLGIVTTKVRQTTEHALKGFGIYEHMDVIISLDDVANPKPDPEPVARAMQALGSDPGRTLMVGDSPVDMQSALAAEAVPVGVAWSLKGDAPLREAGAVHIVHDMRELLPLCGIEANDR